MEEGDISRGGAANDPRIENSAVSGLDPDSALLGERLVWSDDELVAPDEAACERARGLDLDYVRRGPGNEIGEIV